MLTRDFTNLDARIEAERARRLNGAKSKGTWHYWVARGDKEAPPEEHWCRYCAGWYGVPHDGIHDRGICRSAGTGQCACIDCWVVEGRTEGRRPA
jgi:hypothetical protein